MKTVDKLLKTIRRETGQQTFKEEEKLHPMQWHNKGQDTIPDGHCDLETETAHLAASVKNTYKSRCVGFISVIIIQFVG